MVYRCRTETPFACNSVPRQAQLIEYQRQQNNVRQLRIINPNVYTYKKAADTAISGFFVALLPYFQCLNNFVINNFVSLSL
nr:MAG TPA: hypothetical protein [Caudoviricetes sp.]